MGEFQHGERNLSRHLPCHPEISIVNGSVTFSSTDEGVSFYYTTNGSDPSTSSTLWNGTAITSGITNEATIKVIAVRSGARNSAVASRQYIQSSGVSSTTVTLNDYEDHNWAYYKGRDIKVGTAADSPNYKDKYKYTLYSPDPRNVKITYRGYNTGGSTIILGSNTVETSTLNSNTSPHVSNATDEGQNTFVYYKTLEKFVIGYFTDNADWNGIPDDPTKENYPYTVISNPFSVRPSTGSGDSKKYYGFAGWKIISGGKYIGRGSYPYTAASNGDVLGLDELIHFVNLDADVTYTPNCTSAEIVLEATWTQATVWPGNVAHTFTGGTYETNFIVANADIASIEQGSPCTIIGMYPDGTTDNSGTRTITGLKVTTTSTTDPYDRSNCVKVEWIRHGSDNFDANGRNMTMGRGIISSSGNGNTAQGNVFGNNTENQDVVNTVKVESGYYSGIANINNKAALATNAINSYVIMGCDYDRARANYYVAASEINSNAYNIKLRSSRIYGPVEQPNLNRGNGQLYMRSLFKSGVFGLSIESEYYFHSYRRPGQRYIEMEGGYNKGYIKGGSDGETSQGSVRAMSIRIKGGRIDGQLACGSTSTFCSGDRLVVITGGRFGGWIAPGSNCTSNSGSHVGETDGTSYVYFGGTAEINSHQFGTTPTIISQSTGGVIYGAGLGYNPSDNTGQMTHGSNVVFADKAYAERGIYGGGAIGQTLTTANIFILGGRVGTVIGQVKIQGSGGFTTDVEAGVFGGACYRGGENAFLYMDDGIVESRICGGSNFSGTLTGNVTMQINGGQVGKDASNTVNVHGGGYGNATRVLGSVNVTVGKAESAAGATIYGDVYGGSAEGMTNGNTALTTDAVTNVTLNAGTINGSLYGGGLGTSSYAADVYGPVTVTVNGGEVTNVFGCNNANGTPKSSVSVTVNHTNPTNTDSGDKVYAIQGVYGGGNLSNYAPSSSQAPIVVINDCASSIKDVYGGGNAAAVPATNVTINGGDIDRAFAGGNGESGVAADVNGNVALTIHGGTINQVFGGSNAHGVISGTSSVTLTKSNPASECFDIKEVFAGGNEAPGKGGSITVGCGAKLGDVYGGANKADIGTSTTPANITLNINGGNIYRVFGGNNASGTIYGTITVNINVEGACADTIGYVYGGGNQAPYTAPSTDNYNWPKVNVIKGHVMHDVYGGGLGLSTDATKGTITGNPQVKIYSGKTSGNDNVKIEGNVFGGGNAGKVIGNTNVQVGVTPAP